MSNLKPCPFCGSDDISVYRYGPWSNYYAQCNNCYALAPDPSTTNLTEKEAIHLWNKRDNFLLNAVLEEAEEKEHIIHCRDCKWWKESDGSFVRGVGYKGKCRMNTEAVYNGDGYCYLAEEKEREE